MLKTLYPILGLLCLGYCSLNAQDFQFDGDIFMPSERSYIQLGNLNFSSNPNTPGDRSGRLTAMEAQISPNYYIRFGPVPRFALVITPKVILRLGDKESFPIKAPSYMPGITLYQRLNVSALQKSPLTRWLITPQHTALLSYRVVHHSNGQKDPFFAPNGRRINFSTGNFSTDFFELGFSWLAVEPGSKKFFSEGKISYERHFDFLTREEDMSGIYYYNRFLLETAFQFGPALQWSVRPELLTGQSTFTSRWAITTTLEYMPFRKSSDLGFFARFYQGPDYYNIRFFQDQTIYGCGIKVRTISQH